MAATGPGNNLPPGKAHRLAEVAELLTSAVSSASRREEIFRVLEVRGFWPALDGLGPAAAVAKGSPFARGAFMCTAWE